MTVLYTNPKGDGIRTHSYSSGSTFDFCRRKYYYERLLGWRQKGENASAKFGVALEDAIRFYHDNGCKLGTGIDEWKRLWLNWKQSDKLIFKDKEGSWEELYRAGAELLRLYEIILPALPIKDPLFQMNLKRELFPGSEYAGIEDQGYVDILSRAPWVHPLLPKVDVPEGSPYRPLIIDVKTSGKSLDVTPDLIQLDPQLRRYASLSNIPDVAFLWFHRSKPIAYERGTEISLLEDLGDLIAGSKGSVYEYDKENDWLSFCPENGLPDILKQLGELKGKGSGERKKELLDGMYTSGTLRKVKSESVTKQRIRFVAVRIDPEDIKEEGQVVAQQVVDIIEANRKNLWPKTGAGVRFPKNNCSWCSHRGLCLKNNQLRDALLVQISTPVPEDDWLDSIGDE